MNKSRRCVLNSLPLLLIPAIAPQWVLARSCTAALGRAAVKPAALKLIVLDRTTSIDPVTANEFIKRLTQWARGGDRMVAVAFGGTQANLLDLRFDGHFEPLSLPTEDVRQMPGRDYKAYVACVAKEDVEKRAMLKAALIEFFAKPDTAKGGRSPILDALLAVASLFCESTSIAKSLFLVSDGIEHVPLGHGTQQPDSSFYSPTGAERVRQLEPLGLVDAIRSASRLPDYRQVHIWHAALGHPPFTRGGPPMQRDTAEMGSLRGFWETYWRASGATLLEFGYPIPLRQLNE